MSSSNPLWWCHLYEGSTRYATWFEILGSNDVPLKSPASFEAELGYPVTEKAECYELDIEGMKAAQKQRLAKWIAARFDTSIEEALEEIYTRGFTIRATDVIVAFSLRAFI
jgi:hypothetical protein